MTSPDEPSAQPPQRAAWPGEPLAPAEPLAPGEDRPGVAEAPPLDDAKAEPEEAAPLPPTPYWPTPPEQPTRYPMVYEVEYPAGGLSRWKTLLRLVLAIPVLLAAGFVASALWGAMQIGWLTVLCRRTYPAWLFAGVTGGLGFLARAQAYMGLLTDRYPSFDASQGSPVTLVYDAPLPGELSRWRVAVWKSMVLLPHLIVLWLLWFCVAVLTVFAWLGILFTGQFPRGLFGFITGVHRWQFRAAGYFASLNDASPPFSLSSSAGPGRGGAALTCGILGFLIGPACIGAVVTAGVLVDDTERRDVSYALLLEGKPGASPFYAFNGDTRLYALALARGDDPNDVLANELGLGAGQRVVAFDVEHRAFSGGGRIWAGDATIRYRDGDRGRTAKATVVLVDGGALVVQAGGSGTMSAKVAAGQLVTVRLVFIIPADAKVTALDLTTPWSTAGPTLRYRFH